MTNSATANRIKKQVDRWYPLKDVAEQIRLVKAANEGLRFPVIPAGRRCLEEGTLVATPSGPVAIQNLKVGDYVIGYDNGAHVTTVTDIWDNGEQEVIALKSRNTEFLAATKTHKLWATNESMLDKRRPHIAEKYSRVEVGNLTKRSRVKKQYCHDLINGGEKNVKYTYVLGAMSGNGCCRESGGGSGVHQKNLYISSPDDSVPKKIATMLECEFKSNHEENYTYAICLGNGAVEKVPFYKAWMHNRYSHEKISPWPEVDLWDKESALSFLAGVLDTDGSVYFKSESRKEIVVAISMQALDVIKTCQKIIFKYMQELFTIHEDSREKYKNGSVHCLRSGSNGQALHLIDCLKEYSLRCQNINIDDVSCRGSGHNRIGLAKSSTRIATTYDITVGNSTNLYILHHGGIVTSNSGKSERAKRHIVKSAFKIPGMYFAAAPTHDQAKKIFWNDLKDLAISAALPKPPSESNRIIFLPNGSEIHVMGMDKPERIEGIPWKGGILDEVANIKEHAINENIMPALNTKTPNDPNYKAWCWFLGVPEGLNHYYDMAMRAKSGVDPDMGYFHWLSSEVLDADVLEKEKARLSPRQYRQEYEASFETASGRIYEDYCEKNHTRRTIQPHERLMWCHDQNFTPLSSAIAVREGNQIFLLDEIVLESAVSKQSAIEFVDKFRNHQNKHVLIYGDPSGRNGEKHAHESDYEEIEKVLRNNKWTYERRVDTSHPSIKDRQNAVRAKICNALGNRTLFVNPATAKWCDKGLSTVQLQKGSSFQEDQTNPYQHITTAIGYMTSREFPIQSGTTTVGRI